MNHGVIVIVAPKDAYSELLDSVCWSLSDKYWCSVTWKHHDNRNNKTWTAYNTEEECSTPTAAYAAKQLYRTYYREDYG